MRCEDVYITYQLLHLLLHFMGVKNCNRVAKHGIFASDHSLKAYHTFLRNMIINIQFSYMYQRIWDLRDRLGAFHLVRTHLGGMGGVNPPIHFHCVLHAKRGWVGPDSM